MKAVVDRVVQYPHRYQLKNVNTGEVLGTFDLEPITGTISVVGTKIDKELFDSIASDISARLVSNGGDAKNNVITYTMASNRSNIVSGEKLSVSFGKIAKYFNDLKAVAFSGSKADIDLGNVDNTSDKDKPVSNATQQALNNKANSSDVYTKTETDGLLNNKANKSDVYTKSETDGLLNDKANKTETDNKINEPLYNLGAYDTISGNVITRQTGYVNGKDYLSKTISKNGVNNPYLTIDNIYVDYIENIIGNCNRVDTNSWWNSTFSNVTISYDSTYKFLVIMLPNGATDTSSLNNIYIQYKLATATTEKVEANHYARYNERFILEHNKSEAERSCNLFNNDGNESLNRIGLVVGNTYTLSTNENQFIIKISSASGSATSLVEAYNANKATFVWDGQENNVYFINNDYSTKKLTDYQIMLNEGSVALPYQPYEGKVVHEKGLENASVKLADNYKYGRGVNIPNSTSFTNSFVQDIFGTTDNNNYHIVELRTIREAPPSLLGDFSSGIAWRGNDTYGSLMVSYNTPKIRVSGGNGLNPVWSVDLIHTVNIGTYLTNNLKTINGNSIVGSSSEDISITPGIFTKLGNKTNFSFDSGSYLVVANNGMVTVTGTDPLNVGSSANKKYLGIFMVTIAEYDGGQSLRVNTEQVYFGDYASGTISGPTFTIYKLN